jgi:hypothetical protein
VGSGTCRCMHWPTSFTGADSCDWPWPLARRNSPSLEHLNLANPIPPCRRRYPPASKRPPVSLEGVVSHSPVTPTRPSRRLASLVSLFGLRASISSRLWLSSELSSCARLNRLLCDTPPCCHRGKQNSSILSSRRLRLTLRQIKSDDPLAESKPQICAPS